MVIHWFSLLGALFFGLIPPRLLIRTECRYLPFERLWERVTTSEKKQRRRRWWKLPLVWIDPVRGYVAASLISDAFTVPVETTGVEKALPVVFTFLILLVMLCVQTSGRRKQGETVSPTGFLGGMIAALFPWIVTVSVLVIGVTAAVAMNSFIAGYLLATFTTAGCGYAFLGRSPWLAVYTTLVATPMVINWLRRTTLVMPLRS